jgi:hypothetical protein
MIEPGTYAAKALEAGLGVTSTGKEQVAVQFELADSQRITWYGYFTDKTRKGTFEALRACGWVGDNLADMTGITENEVELVIQHEPDQNGTARARVRWVNRPGGGGLAMAKPMDAASAAAFAESMRGAVVAHEAEAVGQGQPAYDDDPI